MESLRAVCAADLHLGQRKFPNARTVHNGRNTREVDVEIGFDRFIDKCIAIRPDLVLLAGDIFDKIDPLNYALIAFRRGMRRLSDEGIQAVVIAGNHEASASARTLTPVLLPSDIPGIYCFDQPDVLDLQIRGLSVAIHCAPHVHTQAVLPQNPRTPADVRILLMHAPVRSSAAPNALNPHYAPQSAPDAAQLAEHYDAVVLGDYHDFTPLVPGKTAFYPGAIERTSSNIWDESAEKGFVVIDTAQPGVYQFEPLPTRPTHSFTLHPPKSTADYVDLVNGSMASLLTNPEHAGAMLRLKAVDFPRSERHRLDRSLERSLKAHALHFHLDVRYRKPDPLPAPTAVPSGGLPARATEHFSATNPTTSQTALALLKLPTTDDAIPRLLSARIRRSFEPTA